MENLIKITIDWILRVTGIITYIFLIFKIFYNKEYIDNVKIKKINIDNTDFLNKEFHFIRTYEHRTSKTYTDLFLFYPKNTDIKEIEFFSLKYDKKLSEDKLLHKEKNLIHNHCLIIKTIVPETIPDLKIKWKTGRGEIGEYIFYYNGYNGNVDIASYKYKLTLKRKIFTILKFIDKINIFN